MPEDTYNALPGPEEEPEQDQPEPQREKTATPDYRQFAGNPWWNRRWVRSYAFPLGVIAFAAIVLVSRTTSVVTTAFQQTPGRDPSVSELRRDIRGDTRRPPNPFQSKPTPETEQGEQKTTGTGGGNDYAQQIAEEKRRHRVEAFASPIFAENAPTAKPVQNSQPSQAPVDLSGADLSGLSPQQTAQLKRYLQAQQAVQDDQMATVAAPSTQGQAASATPQPTVLNAREPQKRQNAELNQAAGPFHKIFPGTVVEAAVDTALESTMTGVVLAHFTRDVHTFNLLGPVLIPAGTQLVGEAAPVTSQNQPRLKVTFDLAIEPNGYCLNLDQFEAMTQKGETGLADSVNNHWMRTIGIAAVVGVIEGLAELNAGVNILSPRTEIYSSLGSEAGREGIRILDRFLNVPPTVRVNPGSRIRIVFPVGLDGVPEYQNTQMAANL